MIHVSVEVHAKNNDVQVSVPGSSGGGPVVFKEIVQKIPNGGRTRDLLGVNET